MKLSTKVIGIVVLSLILIVLIFAGSHNASALIRLNGISLNGISQNGTQLNGIILPGE